MGSERIAIYGAGSIGCFVGGLLVEAGRRVAFLVRPRVAEELQANGLRLTDYSGFALALPSAKLDLQTSSDCLRDASHILLTVKSADTVSAAEDIKATSPAGALVISLQNGVENVDALRAQLGQDRVLGGMVPFNVVHKAAGHFHRGTSGDIVIEAGRPDALALLTVPHLPIAASSHMAGVQWGKLIVNLNNALNALSGLPLKQQLETHAWRAILADQIAEAVSVLKAASIRPVPATKVPAALLPPLLRLPDPLFKLAARSMLKIDPEARSSMWEDLVQRRRTEVDYLQGAIVRLAARLQLRAPMSEHILRLVKQAEAARSGPPGLRPEQVAVN